jgi:hypothetical protein
MHLKNFLGRLYVAIALAITCSLHAQLNDFTISASPIAQTCLGNGALNFTVSGNNPQAALEFAVYLLPNTTTAFTTVTTMSAQNLVAGNYQIIATQTLNGASNTASATATVGDNVHPLAYNFDVVNAGCNSDGSITINVTSGNVTAYEIISGPVTFPLQNTPVFTGLPPGQYHVRVHDNCGEALVTTVEVINETSDINLTVNSDYVVLQACNSITVQHYYSSENAINWPLTFEYTVHPPGGGASVIVTSVVNSGGLYNVINTTIPFYVGQIYFYDIKITDACGNQFNFPHFSLIRSLDFEVRQAFDPCQPVGLLLETNGYVTYPVTVTFITAPPAFNPVQYNASHPLFEDPGMEYSLTGSTIPTGSYTVKITDACGRSMQKSFVVGPNVGGPLIEIYTSGCQTADVEVSMTKDIVEASIIVAPGAYNAALPNDVMEFSNGGGSLFIENLPAGAYVLYLKDECGYEFNIDINIIMYSIEIKEDEKRKFLKYISNSIDNIIDNKIAIAKINDIYNKIVFILVSFISVNILRFKNII